MNLLVAFSSEAYVLGTYSSVEAFERAYNTNIAELELGPIFTLDKVNYTDDEQDDSINTRYIVKDKNGDDTDEEIILYNIVLDHFSAINT